MQTVPHNPTSGVYPAVGDYLHALEVRAPSRFLFVSGTMGLDPSGVAGANLTEQLDLVWSNLRAILAAADMTVDNIVRLTSYLRDAAYAEPNAAAPGRRAGRAAHPHHRHRYPNVDRRVAHRVGDRRGRLTLGSVGHMADDGIIARIDELMAEEHALRSQAVGHGLDADQQERLAELERRLDQCWDLLRQRRARAEFGGNPDDAEPRPISEVESYRQ